MLYCTAGAPDSTQPPDPSEVTIPISAPLVSDVVEADTLEHVPDAEDEPLDDPDVEQEHPPSRPCIDIDSLTIADLKEIVRFLPSDLQQYHYFWGDAG